MIDTRRSLRRLGRVVAAAVVPLLWLALLLVAADVEPSLAAKKRKRAPVPLPVWVQEAVQRAPASSTHDVVWLHDEEIVAPRLEGGRLEHYRIAAKVFRPAGLDVVGSYAISIVGGDEARVIGAWTLRGDDEVLAADPADFVELPALDSALTFYDASTFSIDAPGAGVGSIVAYEVAVVRTLDTAATGFLFGSTRWPTLHARFELRLPDGWSSTAIGQGDKVWEEAETESGVVYTASNQEPIVRETDGPSAFELIPMVWVHWVDPAGARGYKDWDAVAAWFHEFAEPSMNEPGEATAVSERLKPASSSDWLAALAEAYGFAAREVRYVAIDVGLGVGAGYKPATPATVCDKRYGDCKDKSFLLRALVAPWGTATYPVLVRTEHLGPLPEEVPGPGLFNHCIAAVRLPDGVGTDLWSVVELESVGRVALLDATARSGSPWDLPTAVQGTTALLIHPDGGTLIELPRRPHDAATATRVLDAEIDDQGTITRGTFVETWTGNRAAAVREAYHGLSDSEHSSEMKEYLERRFPGSRIESYDVAGLDDVTEPVVETTTIVGGRWGQRVGDLLILEAGSPAPGVIASRLPRPPRTQPYRIGLPIRENLKVSVRLPEGWKPEEIPESWSMDEAQFDAEAAWSFRDGVLTYDRSMRTLKTEVAADEYAAFFETARIARDRDRLSLVLVHAD